MVKTVALFIVMITSSYSYAQINKTDSLKNELDRYTKMDTGKIKRCWIIAAAFTIQMLRNHFK
jgi:hypothetical protein